MRILYVTTRETAYPRNQTLIAALRRFGPVDVVAPRGGGQGFDSRAAYALGMASVVVRALARALSPSRRHDILVLGFLAQPLAVVLRPIWRGRLVSDCMISVFDTLCFDKQLAAPDSARGRVARWLDRYLVHHSDALIFDTREHGQYFRELAGPPFRPAAIVPVGARTLGPGGGVARSRPDRLQVVFAGSFIPLQGARVIVEAAALLQNEPIDFTIIGAGQELADATALAQVHQLANLRFVGWLDMPSLDDWYRRADIILGIFGLTSKTQRVIPNKVFEALSIGKPVLTSDTPAIRELFVPGRDMVCCPPGDPDALAGALRWALAHRDQLETIGRAGQEAYARQASADALAVALQPLFDGSGPLRPAS